MIPTVENFILLALIIGFSGLIGWRLRGTPRVRTTAPLPPSGNRCACGCTDLIRYSSLNMKQCPDCKTMIPWDLSPGQLPLVGSNRQDRKIPVDVNDGLVNTQHIETK